MSPCSNQAFRIGLLLTILINYIKVLDFAPRVAIYQKYIELGSDGIIVCFYIWQSSCFKISFVQAKSRAL